jgi:ATP-binding cassette subfamily B protein RaxB
MKEQRRFELNFRLGRNLPVIHQAEAAECGLAALAMIARFHGLNIDLAELRRRASTSLKGANLAKLMEISHRLGFNSRALRLELEELGQLKMPCVLHWDLDHFVVLKEVRRNRVIIHDPARGAVTFTLADASSHFTGIALELEPSADFKAEQGDKQLSLRALLGSVVGIRKAILQIFLLALGLEAFVLIGPFYMQLVIDQSLVSSDRDLLMMLGMSFLLVAIFQAMVTALRSWSITWLSANVVVQWITRLFGQLLQLPLDYFEKRHVGDIVSRFNSVQTIQKTLTTQFVSAVLDGVMSCLTLVVMFVYSVKLALLVLLGFVLYLTLRWAFFNPLRNATEEQIVYSARQQSDLLESLRGIQSIKLANQQDVRRGRYANAQVETTNRDVIIQKLTMFYQAGNDLIFGVERVVLIWLAALLVLKGELTAGMLVSFVTYADQFASRAGKFVDQWNDFRMLILHAERVSDISHAEPESDVYPVSEAQPKDASVEVRNLGFRYCDDEPWVIRHCSFRVEPGECVAIAGSSGCGKTTLAKLILGLLKPSEGQVLFGGVDIRKLGLARYREEVGAVLQDDQLFAGSIAENIAFHTYPIDEAQVRASARDARVDTEIDAMTMGYYSLVGDMGSSLSGGQKQRVLIARALYRRPKLLVLDEATSHLDVAKERQVNQTVQALSLTRIVIAHRPETLASADRLIVLDQGNFAADAPQVIQETDHRIIA